MKVEERESLIKIGSIAFDIETGMFWYFGVEKRCTGKIQ